MALVQPKQKPRLGQRVVEGVFLVAAVYFALSSTWQITHSALIDPPHDSPGHP